MPIYEYKCADGHEFEIRQSMTDDPVTVCEACGKPVERIFRPVAVHFKGSGFYTTDYAKKESVPANSDGASKESSSKDSGAGNSKSSDSGSSSEKTAKAASDR